MKHSNQTVVAMVASGSLALLLASPVQAVIVDGRSVAGVKLGDTKSQVRKTLGKPRSESASDLLYPGLRVSFSKTRVSGILVFDRKQKNAKGIKVGSSFAAVRKAYPAAKCTKSASEAPYIPVCGLSNLRGGASMTFRFDTFGSKGRVNEIGLYRGALPGSN